MMQERRPIPAQRLNMDEMAYLEGKPSKNIVTQLLEVEVLFKGMQLFAKTMCNDYSSTMKEELVSWGINTKKDLQGGMISSLRCTFRRTIHIGLFLNENQ
jgi:hypothetical protein